MSGDCQVGWGSSTRRGGGRSGSAGPKRGSLNVGAWKSQESGRKAPLSCIAAFSMSQCSFSFVAAQFLVKTTSALHKSECCSTVCEVAAQLLLFACGMLQGWGLEEWSSVLADWFPFLKMAPTVQVFREGPNLEVPKRHPPKGLPGNLLEFYLNFLNPWNFTRILLAFHCYHWKGDPTEKKIWRIIFLNITVAVSG